MTGSSEANYKTGALSPDRIAQAFPVAREVAGDLTLEAWSEFARTMVAGGREFALPSGIIVAELEGYIRGLFTYHVVPDLSYGRTLVARDLAVLQLIARESLADALLKEIHQLARRHRCDAIHAYVRPESAWMVGYFEDRGHQVEKLVLCRRLAVSA